MHSHPKLHPYPLPMKAFMLRGKLQYALTKNFSCIGKFARDWVCKGLGKQAVHICMHSDIPSPQVVAVVIWVLGPL
jgi:hypothetical protein